MTEAEQEIFRQARVKQATRIKTEAHAHKVCLVCSSISRNSAAVCPVCHAYQWDYAQAAVVAAVDAASLTVFPSTLGYAPSFRRDYSPPFVVG